MVGNELVHCEHLFINYTDRIHQPNFECNLMVKLFIILHTVTVVHVSCSQCLTLLLDYAKCALLCSLVHRNINILVLTKIDKTQKMWENK